MPATYLIIILCLIVFLLFFVYGCISLAPWVPVRLKDLPRLLELAQPHAGKIFYDLGCGDVLAVRYLAEHSAALAKGIEINPFLSGWAKIKSRLSPAAERQEIIWGNLFKANLSAADIIFVFGMPRTLAEKLKGKLAKELKPGAKVISYAFSFPGWEAQLIKNKPTQKDISFYLYQR